MAAHETPGGQAPTATSHNRRAVARVWKAVNQPVLLEVGSDRRAMHRDRTASCLGFACMRPYVGDDAQVEVVGSTTPYESEHDSPLFDMFREVLTEHDKGREVVPSWFRAP